MHQFMHPHYVFASLEREACEAVQRRNVSPYTMVPATDHFGQQIHVMLWQVEADQTVTLIDRLRTLKVTDR